MNIDCHQWAITTLGLAELAPGEFPSILWCQTLFFFKKIHRPADSAWCHGSNLTFIFPKKKYWTLKCMNFCNVFFSCFFCEPPDTCVFPQSAGCHHRYRHNLRLPWWDGRRLPADNRPGETLQVPESVHKPVLPQTRDTGCQDGTSTSSCGECGPANAVLQHAVFQQAVTKVLFCFSSLNSIITSLLPWNNLLECSEHMQSVWMCWTHMGLLCELCPLNMSLDVILKSEYQLFNTKSKNSGFIF